MGDAGGEKIDVDWGKVGLEAAKGAVKGAIAGTGDELPVSVGDFCGLDYDVPDREKKD